MRAGVEGHVQPNVVGAVGKSAATAIAPSPVAAAALPVAVVIALARRA